MPYNAHGTSTSVCVCQPDKHATNHLPDDTFNAGIQHPARNRDKDGMAPSQGSSFSGSCGPRLEGDEAANKNCIMTD